MGTRQYRRNSRGQFAGSGGRVTFGRAGGFAHAGHRANVANKRAAQARRRALARKGVKIAAAGVAIVAAGAIARRL